MFDPMKYTDTGTRSVKQQDGPVTYQDLTHEGGPTGETKSEGIVTYQDPVQPAVETTERKAVKTKQRKVTNKQRTTDKAKRAK